MLVVVLGVLGIEDEVLVVVVVDVGKVDAAAVA